MIYVDLTNTITDKMPSHPQDIPVELKPTLLYAEHGVANHSLCGSVHMGTHIDAPGHFTEIDKKITDYPISRFIGQAVCINARGKKIIDIDSLVNVQLMTMVIFYTGWDARFYEKDYFYDHPVINEECAQFLIDSNVTLVGVDFPSVDRAPYSVHKLLLRNDVLILENLTNLQQVINKRFDFMALPIKVDAHGAPARVVARVL